MSKRLAIVLLSVGIAALIGVMIWAIGPWAHWGWNMFWDFSHVTREADTEVEYTESPASEIDAVEISFVAEDIQIEKGESDRIAVHQYSSANLAEEYRMRVRTDGRKLFVEAGTYSDSLAIMRRVPYSRIVIQIPAELASGLSAATTSGEVSIADVDAASIEASTVSGGVQMDRVAGKTCSATSTSGDVIASAVTCDSLDVSTTSGCIQIDQSSADKVNCSAISGEVSVDGTFPELQMESTSGDLDASLRSSSQITASTTSGTVRMQVDDASKLTSLSADTLSGEVSIALPPGTAVNVDFESVSGSMHTPEGNGALVMTGTGIPINIGTTSGDLIFE